MAEAADRELARVPMGERILLLPHCLRPSRGCSGKMTRTGLLCPSECTLPCAIRALREEALRLGYKGTFVAPGGALALRVIQETQPKGIVAVACHKELREGMEAVSGLEGFQPVVATLPLTRDGCVDTEVNVDEALRLLRLGLRTETNPKERAASVL